MTFERTASGQANRAIFLGVDYVCYVEGVDQAEAGDDIAFWKSALRSLRPDISIWFTCRGGKPVLERLATEIVANNIQRTLVAMDADYSRFYPGRLIVDRRVLYTFGYSWENDLYFSEHAVECHTIFTKCQNVPVDVRNHYLDKWSTFAKASFWVMIADFLALGRKTSVVPRESPGRIVVKDPGGAPTINVTQARLLTYQAKTSRHVGPPAPYLSRPNNPQKDMVGKVIGLAARYVANSAIRAFSNARDVGAEHFHQIALMFFENALRSQALNPVLNHHRAQAAAI